MRRAFVIGIAVLAAVAAVPMPVAAHGLVGRLESPLPLAVYVTGAALAVLLSFVFLIARDVRSVSIPHGTPRMVPALLILLLRGLGLLGWLWIVAQTLIGGSSDAEVAGLFLWVYGWVGLAILSALVGPVWIWLNPFTTLFDLGAAGLRRLGVQGWDPLPYRFGAWPGVAGLAIVVWLELVYLGGSLGAILIAYTLFTLLMMAQFGRDPWRAHGEAFSVWFATLNRLAPFAPAQDGDDRWVRRRPFLTGLLEPGWTRAHVVLVALATGSILFDGLSQTEPWFAVFGLPSLPIATLQLAGFLGVIVALTLGVARLVGLAALGAGLLPIAVGYLIAHYLTYLLGDGQRLWIAISDPLQLGWDLFGTAFYEPGTDWIPPSLLWTVQLAAVVGGHILGAWGGHVVAIRDAPRRADMRLRQVPLAALMVALTATTLWSLGQAIVNEPAQQSQAVRSLAADGG